nr:ChaB family protein [Methanoculleus marisnigri]
MRDLLPEHGRDIYREAFNSAREQYADPSERQNPEESREEVAHKVTRAAVERVYEKGPGSERRKEEAKRQVVLRDRQPEAASPESGCHFSMSILLYCHKN